MAQVVERVLGERRPAGGGQDPQLDGGEPDQHQAEHEAGHGEPDERPGGGDPVDRAARPPGRVQGHRQGQAERHHLGGDEEFEGDRDPVGEFGGDGHAGGQRVAEVAVQGVVEPAPGGDEHVVVQAELRLVRGDLLGRGGGAERGEGGGAGHEVGQGECRDGDQQQDRGGPPGPPGDAPRGPEDGRQGGSRRGRGRCVGRRHFFTHSTAGETLTTVRFDTSGSPPSSAEARKPTGFSVRKSIGTSATISCAASW